MWGKLENPMSYTLADLIDIEKTQKLLENFFEVVGVPAAIIDLEGVVIVSSPWHRLCADFHRTNEELRQRCVESDTILANELLDGKSFSLYRCPNGLTDAASPIMIEEKHLANAFIGQFFIQKPDLTFFRRQAKEHGFDEAAYLEALSEIPVVSENTLPSLLSFLTLFAEMVANLGLKHLRQLEIEKALRESREDLNRAQAVANTGSWRLNVLRNDLQWSEQTYRIFGIPQGTPLTYEKFLATVHSDDRQFTDQAWQAALGGEPYDIEHRIIVGDELKWVRERAELEFDGEGKLLGGFGTVQDITERKRNERFSRIRLDLLELAASHSTDELLQKALDEINEQTNSSIAFIHFVASDQKTLALQAWSTRTLEEFCKAPGKGTHYSISQAGVWVDCVHEKHPVVHNDYHTLPHRKGMPEGHPAVIRELVVPIMRSNKVVAILGVGNKPTDYTQEDIGIASYLADVAWAIAARKMLEEELKESHDLLEMRVQERTAELRESEERLRCLSGRLLAAQEEERKRIGAEIHDSIGSSLAAVIFSLESEREKALQNNNKKAIDLLDRLIPITKRVIDETRRIHSGMRPPVLDDVGLIAAIGWYCREFQKSYPQIHIEQEVDTEESEIPESLKIVIFRIIQEGLNNIAKHSKAEFVDLVLYRNGDSMELAIEDNGTGFELNAVLSRNDCSRGLGLTSMRERASLAGGVLTIKSTPVGGTTIRGIWPISR
jgi:PAS domain S-box-containing protein